MYSKEYQVALLPDTLLFCIFIAVIFRCLKNNIYNFKKYLYLIIN